MAAWPDLNTTQNTEVPGLTARRRRYIRQPERQAALTPVKLRLLQYVADYRIVSLPQLAPLVATSPKSARRHLRDLFDAGLIDVVAVPRAALVAPGGVNDARLLFGSAPNIYIPTKTGLRLLVDQGLLDAVPPVPQYGPQNSLFLRHELELRDVRVWLELAARKDTGHNLVCWQDGREASIDLGERSGNGPRVVRPDAWFVYRLGERVLVGLVEYDRGTERGDGRWREKLAGYEALFSGPRLRETTGYTNARVLVIAPDARRRDRLAALIARHTTGRLAAQFWLAERAILGCPELTEAVWRRAVSVALHPLVPLASSGER